MQQRFNILSVMIFSACILVAACAQQAPTAPSALAGDASTSSAQAPGAGYDATGAWDGVLTFSNGDQGQGVLDIIQDDDGNLTGTGEGDPGTYTFTRLGAGKGATITYRLSIVSPDPEGPDCGRDLSGIARLNTQTDTIEARATGIVDDCSTLTVTMTLTRQ